eukprot:TRINITY_DN791_c0_g2_i1.p1 TRINITY_DN791_c0_g2~~TRINITY_DN791_c0_g2_i1.p1  ORF type:complete len:563 (+),score=121.36 TRINITY_DN791_c0_g2_i1:117-1805(+)
MAKERNSENLKPNRLDQASTLNHLYNTLITAQPKDRQLIHAEIDEDHLKQVFDLVSSEDLSVKLNAIRTVAELLKDNEEMRQIVLKEKGLYIEDYIIFNIPKNIFSLYYNVLDKQNIKYDDESDEFRNGFIEFIGAIIRKHPVEFKEGMWCFPKFESDNLSFPDPEDTMIGVREVLFHEEELPEEFKDKDEHDTLGSSLKSSNNLRRVLYNQTISSSSHPSTIASITMFPNNSDAIKSEVIAKKIERSRAKKPTGKSTKKESQSRFGKTIVKSLMTNLDRSQMGQPLISVPVSSFKSKEFAKLGNEAVTLPAPERFDPQDTVSFALSPSVMEHSFQSVNSKRRLLSGKTQATEEVYLNKGLESSLRHPNFVVRTDHSNGITLLSPKKRTFDDEEDIYASHVPVPQLHFSSTNSVDFNDVTRYSTPKQSRFQVGSRIRRPSSRLNSFSSTANSNPLQRTTRSSSIRPQSACSTSRLNKQSSTSRSNSSSISKHVMSHKNNDLVFRIQEQILSDNVGFEKVRMDARKRSEMKKRKRDKTRSVGALKKTIDFPVYPQHSLSLKNI